MGESLHTQAVICNQCGARLTINAETKFVLCTYCGCQLKVFRKEGSCFSEVIEELKEQQEDTSNRLRILELETQLSTLETNWEKKLAAYEAIDKQAFEPVPKHQIKEFLTLAALFLVIPGFLIYSGIEENNTWIILTGFLILLPGIAIAILIITGSIGFYDRQSENRAYYQDLQAYLNQRDYLRREINRLKNPRKVRRRKPPFKAKRRIPSQH